MKTEQKTNGEAPKANLATQEKTIADSVLARVGEFTRAGAIKLPTDYSPGNALKFAYLMLSQAKDKDGKSVLEVCTQASIANALLEMVIQGLSPMKKQCYFIAYGKQLTMLRSYQGSIAVAKRVAPVTSVKGNVIYQDDVFEYSVDSATGTKKIIKHEQKIENIDLNKIKGAYAVVNFKDGSSDLEVMTFAQIKKAWLQGAGGGNTKAHQNFTDEMADKTVINRACKKVINNSDDAALFTGGDADEIQTTVEGTVVEEIKDKANGPEVGFEEVQSSEQVSEEQNQNQEEETNQPAY